MLSQNPDPLDLLRHSINELIDYMKLHQHTRTIEAQSQRSVMQDPTLLDISRRLSCLEESNDITGTKIEEITNKVDRLERKAEMDEWEYRSNSHSSEGESNADFMQRKE